MTCHELDERLDDWVDGTLEGGMARDVEAHLAQCPLCREREQRLRQLLAHAASLPRPQAPAHDLWPGIAARIERETWWKGAAWWRPALLAAAAALVLGVAAVLWSLRAPAPARTVESPATSFVGSALVVLDRVLAAAERDYEAAATVLLEALQRRRAALPADELARVEANLGVIDRALSEVRLALVKDPANPELNRMLVATHRRKVDVLRRVVRLSTAL
jgi:anti-sigma factor RsiW